MLTNAELDHHATYGSLEDLEQTFAQFMASADRGAVWDRPSLRALCPATTVGYDAVDADVGPGGSHFAWRGLEAIVGVPGEHNAVNAAGALTACALAGADPAAIAGALADFTGARRRLELLGTTATGAVVYDDYAHHPTEVAATIAAARSLAPRRVVTVFQPHLFSRTGELAGAFGAGAGRGRRGDPSSASTPRASEPRTSPGSADGSSPLPPRMLRARARSPGCRNWTPLPRT